jgi:hypothetical protein
LASKNAQIPFVTFFQQSGSTPFGLYRCEIAWNMYICSCLH